MPLPRWPAKPLPRLQLETVAAATSEVAIAQAERLQEMVEQDGRGDTFRVTPPTSGPQDPAHQIHPTNSRPAQRAILFRFCFPDPSLQCLLFRLTAGLRAQFRS